MPSDIFGFAAVKMDLKKRCMWITFCGFTMPALK
jgi:hypothetical protein